MDNFKPKSIEELNAVFEEQLAQYNAQREKEFAENDILSQEQKDFYKVSDDEPEEAELEVEEAQEALPEEEPKETEPEIPEEETAVEEEEALENEAEEEFEEEIIPEEEVIETEIQDEVQEEQPDEAQDADELQETAEENDEEGEDPYEVNELFEAEKLAQQEAAIFVANALAENEAEDKAQEAEASNAAFEDPYEEKKLEKPAEEQETPTFYFKQNAEDLKYEAPEQDDVKPQFVEHKRNFEDVKLTRTKDVKAQKKSSKNKEHEKKDHRAAKTALNTLISLALILIVFINGVIFMADMPNRFIGGTGITVCEHSIKGSNVKSGSLLITKKVNNAGDSKVVAATTKDKKTVVDFKQNIPQDADVFAQTVKLVPKAGGAVKYVRKYWFESGLVELAGLLVLLIIRVAVSDKKEKPETKKKSK